MILFTKTDCERCAWVKANCDLSEVRALSVETAEGLALLAYYACVGLAEKPGLPILVMFTDTADPEIVTGIASIASWLGGSLTDDAPQDDCGEVCVL